MDIPPGAGKPPSPDLAAQTQPSGKKKSPGKAPTTTKSAKKKGKKVARRPQPKKTSSGSPVSSLGSLPSDSPLMTRRSREYFLQQKDLEQLPELSTDELEKYLWRGIKAAINDIEEKGPSLETTYVVASNLCQCNRPKDARPYAELLMALAPPGHPHHPLACLWMGITLYQSTGFFNEEIIRLLKTAHDAGIPLAAKYMMHAYSGINNTLSEVKWTNPKAFLNIARKFKRHNDAHYQALRKAMPKDPLGLPLTQQMFYDYRIFTEFRGTFLSEVDIHQFNLLICQLMAAPDDQVSALCEKIEARVTEYSTQHGPSHILPALYLYARGCRSGENQQLFEVLSKKQHCLSQFCAADLIKQWGTPYSQKRFDLLSASKGWIGAYQHQADMLIAEQAFSLAIEVYQQGIRHLTAYLDKTSPILYRTCGGQSEALRAKNYPEACADEVELEELDTVYQHLLFFQGQIELLEEAILEGKTALEKQTEAARSASPKTPAPDSSSESDSEYVDALDKLSLSSSDEEFYTPPESPVSSDNEGFEEVRRRPRPSKSLPIQTPWPSSPPKQYTREELAIKKELRKMSRANDLAVKDKNYDQAETQLKELNYPPKSWLWFVQQDNLCWISHLRAQDQDFLLRHAQGRETWQLAQSILNKTEARIFELINHLTAMAEATAVKAGTVEQNEKKCLATADTLEQLNPKLRSLYGGLYSKLGHLYKTLKDISPTRAESQKNARTGKHYYQLANTIRRRLATT